MKRRSRRKAANYPAVTWITMQPEKSATKSLKSVAEYLSGTQDDIPASMPKRRLCLSPETVKILHEAEKLVDEVEIQLSQMDVDVFEEENSHDNRPKDSRIDEEKLYIKSIVTTMFEKGYYDPESNIVSSRRRYAPKSTVIESARLKKYASRETPKLIEKPAAEKVEECLVCKSNETSRKARSQNEEMIVASTNGDEVKIDKENSQNLNVQRGPSISIQGAFSVQTKNIIDIHPDECNREVPIDHLENIVTYECRYESSAKTPDPGKVVVLTNDAEWNDEKLTSDEARNEIRLKHVDTPIERREKQMESQFWGAYEGVHSHFDDFSLKEPLVMTEVDSLLEQQRKLIRQVHDATEKFDKFLTKTLPSEENSFESRSEKLEKTKENLRIKVNDKMKNDVSKNSNRSTTYETEKTGHTASSSKVRTTAESAQLSENSSATSNTEKNCRKESSENAEYTESFDNSSQTVSEMSNCRKPGREIENRGETDFSSNNSSLFHTETKSNAGFIENLKSLQTLKEMNLFVNAQGKNKTSRSASLSSIGNLAEKDGDEKSLAAEEKETRLYRSTVTDEEQELQSYDLENIPEADHIDKNVEKSNEKTRAETNKETIKLKDNNLDENENSQKTSHLIESISDESGSDFVREVENNDLEAESSEVESDSKLSATLERREENGFESQMKENPSGDESLQSEYTDSASKLGSNNSTESKIENKLSEARNGLSELIKSMNKRFDDSHRRLAEQVINDISKESLEKNNLANEIRAGPCGEEVEKGVLENSKKTDDITLESTVLVTQDNLTTTRSFVTLIEENSTVVQDSLAKRKLILLKNLESCSIPNQRQSKRLFTSTVIGDVEPPNTFAKSKASSTIRSDSSSDVYSEGEICFSSTTSYSAGEIKRKTEQRKLTSSAKTSGSNSTNPNGSLSHSIGEILATNKD